MDPINDQEIAKQIKSKVAELNELDRQAQSQGLTVKYEMNFIEGSLSLDSPRELTVSISRIIAF